MTPNTTGNNQFIVAIVNAYLTVSETPPDKLDELADSLVQLILQAFRRELTSSQDFSLPYKDITDIIFSTEHHLLGDSIHNFRQNVEGAISKFYDEDEDDRHHNTQRKYVRRFMYCHDKLVQHCLLAQAQRDFINSSINDALTTNFQTISQIQNIANQAKNTAEKAEETAEKAEQTYNSMFANYVAVLGIFTSIIVTIYGGINVINVIAQNNQAKMGTLMVLVSLTLLCVVTLLYFLAVTITWITKSHKTNLSIIFMAIMAVCLSCIVIGSWMI